MRPKKSCQFNFKFQNGSAGWSETTEFATENVGRGSRAGALSSPEPELLPENETRSSEINICSEVSLFQGIVLITCFCGISPKICNVIETYRKKGILADIGEIGV